MIYVSSTCIRSKNIKESVTTLAQAGLKNIELSGGTKYYSNYESDLLDLQDKYELNYQVHNYFPPPSKLFVLNLASLDDEIYNRSIDLGIKAIKLSKKLGSKRYGMHAGFLIDINPKEAGKKISYNLPSNRVQAIERYCNAWSVINSEAENDVSLYIENNVLSNTNAKTFFKINPFFFTHYDGYLELKEYFEFKPLLDIAHLYVSANSLDLDFDKELNNLLPLSEYIHISENDGLHDQNNLISNNSFLLQKISEFDLNEKIITIEVYDQIDGVLESYKAIKSLIESNKSEKKQWA